jgi:lipoate-protein ligase A
MIKKSLNFVNLTGKHIYDGLRMQEVLLRHTDQNWFIYNTGPTQPAIVLGYSAKVPTLVDVDLAKKNNIPLIRRFTGGGTVIVDHRAFFTSLIMNAEDLGIKPYPRNIMDWSESVFKPVFSEITTSDGVFSLRENDYVIGDLKVGGNAQSITRGRFVHHTSFLWDFDADNMKYLLMPSKRPDYRGDRDHNDFLTRLCLHIPSREAFLELLVSQLSEKFDLEHVSHEDFASVIVQACDGRPIDELARTSYETI